MITLKSVTIDTDDFDHIKSVYDIEHWGKKTVLKEAMVVSFNPRFTPIKYNASIKIADCEADTFEDSIDKLAEWLERLATALRKRTRCNYDIPFYEDKPSENSE